MNIKALSIALVMLGLASGAEAKAPPSDLQKCLNVAVGGSKRSNQLQIFRHTFYCKPVGNWDRKNGKYLVKGVLVHEHFGGDDHVSYEFMVDGRKFQEDTLKLEFDEGTGLPETGGVILKRLPFVPDIVTDEDIGAAAKKFDKSFEGNWKGASRQIIVLIAKRKAERGFTKPKAKS